MHCVYILVPSIEIDISALTIVIDLNYLTKVLFSQHHYYLICELRCFYNLCVIIIHPSSTPATKLRCGFAGLMINLTDLTFCEKRKIREEKTSFQTFLSWKTVKLAKFTITASRNKNLHLTTLLKYTIRTVFLCKGRSWCFIHFLRSIPTAHHFRILK